MSDIAVCEWYWVVLAAALVLAAVMGAFWRVQLSRTQREHRSLVDMTARLEETVAERTREVEERNATLQREIEERQRQEDALRVADTVFESAAEAIIVTDADNNIVRVNPAFTAITGFTPVEVMGRNPRLLKSGRHGPEFYREMWADLNRLGHWEGEIWNRYKNGDIRAEWLSIAKIRDGEGVAQHLAMFHDITRRKEAEELLRFKAHHDALTELPNRELFKDRLQATINQARRYHRNFALLLIDLDRFKDVNDSLGHTAGDQLLVEAAQRLTSCVRETDTVARLGGDEFAIILSEMTTDDEAEQVAQRAVELLNEPYHLDAGTAHISGCVGIALYPVHGRESDQLLRNADSALYAAKEGGRNTYRIYAPLNRNGKTQANLI
ncbi:MAG: diguanylate cyclase [Pseudomonadota bacterium]|jgi:diguanylate cyclase (GGDEF)-like protein/PAS domain S-box-containing protein